MMREIFLAVALLSSSSYVRLWTVPLVRRHRNEQGQASLLTLVAVVLVVAITVLVVLHLAVPAVLTESLATIVAGIITGMGGAEVTLRRFERRKGPVHPRRATPRIHYDESGTPWHSPSPPKGDDDQGI